jgi:hypothetical protein
MLSYHWQIYHEYGSILIDASTLETVTISAPPFSTSPHSLAGPGDSVDFGGTASTPVTKRD